jgi:hypothetical protein
MHSLVATAAPPEIITNAQFATLAHTPTVERTELGTATCIRLVVHLFFAHSFQPSVSRLGTYPRSLIVHSCGVLRRCSQKQQK